MDQRATALPVESVSAGQARRFVSDTLETWGLDDLRDEALLLTSELVTNAVLHAGAPGITLTLRRLADGLRIEVTDPSPVIPTVRHYNVHSGTGRGMALVQAWSRAWGSDAHPPGKVVWFELSGSPRR